MKQFPLFIFLVLWVFSIVVSCKGPITSTLDTQGLDTSELIKPKAMLQSDQSESDTSELIKPKAMLQSNQPESVQYDRPEASQSSHEIKIVIKTDRVKSLQFDGRTIYNRDQSKTEEFSKNVSISLEGVASDKKYININLGKNYLGEDRFVKIKVSNRNDEISLVVDERGRLYAKYWKYEKKK